ncbi:DUF6455 family protein [Shimia aestuarii]|uniref:DUF6455 family protein n=1 Tax=Shimia aestuarii TaxID=254406 RepID=UPI001FB4AF4A|nr:DUF6455 family protein [Shimia aestuarii]
MTDQSTLRHHAALMDRVADRLGIDLEAAVLTGSMTFDEVSEAVLRCVACANPEDCAHWLDREEARAEAPPVYCRNRALMTRLAGDSA